MCCSYWYIVLSQKNSYPLHETERIKDSGLDYYIHVPENSWHDSQHKFNAQVQNENRSPVLKKKSEHSELWNFVHRPTTAPWEVAVNGASCFDASAATQSLQNPYELVDAVEALAGDDNLLPPTYDGAPSQVPSHDPFHLDWPHW